MSSTRDISGASPVEPPAVTRGQDGTWRYEGTDVVAVGARDVTLGELVRPRLLGREGEEPEAVILSLSEIIADARLNWILQRGKKLDGADEPLFLVPVEVWQERASEPVQAWLPEHSGSGVERCLAVAERSWRFARQALDEAGRDRMRRILLATRMGRSRRDIGEILGISAGRVQQLNDDPPPELVVEVDDFIQDAAKIAALLRSGRTRRDELSYDHGLGADRFDEVLEDMLTAGLLEETSDGLQLTDDARALGQQRVTNPRRTLATRGKRESRAPR